MATVTGSLRKNSITLDDIQTTDLTVTGSLTINGTSTTLNSTNTTVTDSIIELNSGLTGANTKDIGFIFERGSTGNNAGFVWDESADIFTVFTTTDTAASDTVNTTSVANFQAGSFYGNGANLTSLNATNISSGTLANARLPDLTVSDFAGSAIQTGSESFADSDTALMTAAAVQDKILSYSYLQGNQTITLSGDVSGSGTTSIAVTIADDSHNHIISNVDGLQTALDAKLPLSGGNVTGAINLTSTTSTSPAITFNTNSGTDASVDMAIRATGEGLDFFEPEDTDKIHMRIVDDNGVNAVFGLRTGTGDGTLRIDGSGNLSNIGNITLTGTVDGRDIAADGTKLDGIESGATADQTASEILTAIKTVDGASSGLDADLLDGQHGSYYAPASTAVTLAGTETITGTKTFDGSSSAPWRLHVSNANDSWDALTFQSTTEWGDTSQYGVLGGDSSEGLMLRRPHVVWSSGTAAADIRLGRSGGTSSGKYVGMGVKASNVGFLSMETTNVLTWDTSYNVNIPNGNLTRASNTVWDAGNDGAGSGLDADTLDGQHASAFLTGNQTITLSGDVSGSGTTSISVTVADDSHNHVISNVDGLQTALDAKLTSSSGLNASNLTSGTIPNARMPTTIGGSGTIFVGSLSGNASTASNTPVYATGANATHYITFAATNGGGSSDGTGSQARLSDGHLTYNPSTNVLGVGGNITVSGTVDGRDVAADGTKLDTIATNADVTPSWVPSSDPSYATQSYVNTQVSNLVDSAPSTLDTLNELAAALGDDANFSTTVTNSIATKLPLAGGTMTGDIILGSSTSIRLPNSSSEGIHTSTDHRVIDSVDSTLRIGDTAKHNIIRLHGQGSDDFKVFYNATDYQIFHAGNPTQITQVGTITSGTWNGGVIASAYLDSDTAHLSGTQTFTGAKTFSAGINLNNSNISGVNNLAFADPGPNEGLQWSNIKIYESPDDLTTNTAGNLQVVYGSTRRLTVTNTGVDVNGALTATTKSFDIEHPTKEGMRLHHGVLEGPEHAVYIRGKSNSYIIELPDYWEGLVHEDTITVQLTPIGGQNDMWVENIEDNKVYINCEREIKQYFYYIQAERKDVERFEVEYEV